jgi:hypothetical protein
MNLISVQQHDLRETDENMYLLSENNKTNGEQGHHPHSALSVGWAQREINVT